jgi:hypothetical protein
VCFVDSTSAEADPAGSEVAMEPKEPMSSEASAVEPSVSATGAMAVDSTAATSTANAT